MAETDVRVARYPRVSVEDTIALNFTEPQYITAGSGHTAIYMDEDVARLLYERLQQLFATPGQPPIPVDLNCEDEDA